MVCIDSTATAEAKMTKNFAPLHKLPMTSHAGLKIAKHFLLFLKLQNQDSDRF